MGNGSKQIKIIIEAKLLRRGERRREMKNIPDKIWLITGLSNTDEEVKDFKELNEVTWSEEKIFDSDIPFERVINKNDLWHSVADGDLPKRDVDEHHTLIAFGAGIGFEYDVQYIAEDECFGFSLSNGFGEENDFEILDGVEYWMEIPELPE